MDSLPINGLDLTVGIVLLLSAVLAFMRGFVHEILSVAAWIGAVLAALYGMPYLRPAARDLIPIEWAADAAAAVVIFLIVLVALSILTKMMAKTIQASALNNLDRTLGFVYGLARAAVILAVALIITDWLIERSDRPDWMRSAKTLPLVEATADLIRDVLPESFIQAEDAAKDAAGTIEDAIDAQRDFERLVQPEPGADPDADSSPDGAYDDRERSNMDRLFQTNQDPEER